MADNRGKTLKNRAKAKKEDAKGGRAKSMNKMDEMTGTTQLNRDEEGRFESS